MTDVDCESQQQKREPLAPLQTAGCYGHQDAEILKYAADLRKFEIERFWTRSIIFWGFISATLVAFGVAKDFPRLQTLAAYYGLLCSIAWSLQNRGSKYWHESWEQKVEAVQIKVLGTDLFSNKEPIKMRKGLFGPWLQARRYSSSRLLMILSDASCLVWLSLLWAPLAIDRAAPFDFLKILTVGVAALLSAALVLGAKSQ